ncbi:putative photosynthetic complex assembly protein PuhE [Fulvimarina sp. MAC8]|uniref:putative photosynthetic complex assembly protein PuhE n=1 Tax=Fulvimarina sp. MAC8 TaxID=3162874 RepID=UPI0032ECF639
MIEYVLPALFALVVWWASTVVIIYLDGLPQKTFKYSMIGATVVFALSLWGLNWSAQDTSVTGAYYAFTFGLLAWGWQEMSFYMGYVTGPRKQPCPESCRGWPHFVHAVQTSLWHELAIIAAAVVVVSLTWGAPNQIGMWTFMVLWWMHQSAKLNVFFGVRNLNEEFLPEHLEFLKGFLNKRSMNLLFPFSVTISTVITVLLFAWAFADGASQFEMAGYTFLGVLMALAILEHWMLVLPMPSGAIWAPGLKSRGEKKPFAVDIVVGFLGAGKTTTLRRMLSEANPAEKTVVLVNDFGELGIDGSLLSGQGADVVELPNGCICCSLRKDLSAQLREVVANMAPDRVLIEPSGVADVASLLQVLAAPEIATNVKATKLFTVIDAGAFLADYARMPDYFDVQARIAPVFILNKIDLVSDSELSAVRETLIALNPKAKILPARYGAVEEELIPSQAIYVHSGANEELDAGNDHETHGHHHHDHGPAHHEHGHEGHDHHHGHGHHHPEPGLGLGSWSRSLTRPIATDELSARLHMVARGDAGRVDRMKGIAKSGEGWMRFDIAGGRVSMSVHIPQKNEAARALAIGKDLNASKLDRLFEVAASEARDEAETQPKGGFGAEPALAV